MKAGAADHGCINGRRGWASSRSRIAIALALTALAVSAPAALGKRHHPSRGTIVGQITANGSPPVARAAGVVNVLTSGGKMVTSQHVRAGHLFRIKLAPGVYVLVDAADNGPYGPCQGSRVRVRSRRLVRTVVYAACDAP